MSRKCTQCGSLNVRRSRMRKGERSLSKILLMPVHCRDCKARIWVPYSKAYVVAGLASVCSLLLAYFIWMGIIMPDQNIERLEQLNTGVVNMEMTDTTPTLYEDSEFELRSKNSFNNAMSEPRRKENTIETRSNTSLTETHADDRFYTVELYQEKAQAGDVDAQYQLGVLFMNGNGTIQDFEEAAKWFKLAANKNHALAQFQLGLIYKTGYGIPIDLEKSYMWFNISAAAGVKKAVIARDNIMRALSSEQLKRAQKSSREWLINSKNKVIADKKK